MFFISVFRNDLNSIKKIVSQLPDYVLDYREKCDFLKILFLRAESILIILVRKQGEVGKD